MKERPGLVVQGHDYSVFSFMVVLGMGSFAFLPCRCVDVSYSAPLSNTAAVVQAIGPRYSHMSSSPRA